jgi:hypothetical protein
MGGVNTLWPVFGISNQMLAAVALMLSSVVLFRMKQQRHAWVTLLPTAWLLICTVSAGVLKIASADPRVGFLAHAAKVKAALDRGELLGPAKSMAQMHQMLLNDRIDAGLCALFLAVVASVLVFAIRACFRPSRSIARACTKSPTRWSRPNEAGARPDAPDRARHAGAGRLRGLLPAHGRPPCRSPGHDARSSFAIVRTPVMAGQEPGSAADALIGKSHADLGAKSAVGAIAQAHFRTERARLRIGNGQADAGPRGLPEPLPRRR